MKISCKETQFTYNIYHIVKAFFPDSEIEQCVDTKQEPFVILEMDEDSCFSAAKGMKETSGKCFPDAGEGTAGDIKRRVTRQVYDYLSELTGRRLAWGMLTGVRPTKLAMQIMEREKDAGKAAAVLQKEYAVTPQKARLAVEIAGREKALMKPFDCRDGFSLYVGIPFCPSICSYCSFSSSPIGLWRERVEEYLDALCRELAAIAECTRGKKLHTIYIGGGTPTTLEPEQLKRLLSCVDEKFSAHMGKEDSAGKESGAENAAQAECIGGARARRTNLLEYTVEAGRPDSITREKLEVIRSFPVSRISVNPQTMQQKTLDIVGRRHTVQDVKDIFHMARELGFDNINMDLIAGLPGETAQDMKDTLRQIEELKPDSLTIHALAIKRAARMGQEKQSAVRLQSEIEAMVEAGAESAERMGLLPYYLYRQKNIAGNFENVGYAKVDKAGIYNILIMEERQTIYAAGAGATTKLVLPYKIRLDNGKETNLIRTENVKSITEYIRRIDEMIERKHPPGIP